MCRFGCPWDFASLVEFMASIYYVTHIKDKFVIATHFRPNKETSVNMRLKQKKTESTRRLFALTGEKDECRPKHGLNNVCVHYRQIAVK